MNYISTNSALMLCAMCLLSTPGKTHDHVNNDFSFGLKAGLFMVDAPEVESTTPGVQLEYLFSPNLALEINYSQGKTNQDSQGRKLKLESLASFLVLRSSNTTYALAKVGFQHYLNSANPLKEHNLNLSAGIGAGVIINRQVSVESEYTLMNENLTYTGITFRYGF